MRQGLYLAHFIKTSSIQTHQHPAGEGKAKAGNQTLGERCSHTLPLPGSQSWQQAQEILPGLGGPLPQLSQQGHLGA